MLQQKCQDSIGHERTWLEKSLWEKMNSEAGSVRETSGHHESLISSVGERKRRLGGSVLDCQLV